jgi:hypothetical protein
VVRRLPVLQTPAGEDAEAEARPAWQWVLIGLVLTLSIFFPLAVVGTAIGRAVGARLVAQPALAALGVALPVLSAFAVSAASAGAFVGRFGRRAGTSSHLLVGGLGGAALILLAGLGGALSPWTVAFGASVVLIGGGTFFAWLGARFGRRRRP